MAGVRGPKETPGVQMVCTPMASLTYDQKRGLYRIFYSDGLDRHSETVAKLPPGTKRPRKDPPEAERRKLELEELERESRRDQPKDPGRTLAGFLDDDLARYRKAKRKGSADKLEIIMGQLKRFASAKKVTRLGTFGADEARAYLEHRADRGVAGNTLEMEHGYLSGVWSRAVKRGEVRANPWAGLGGDNLPAPRKEPPRPSWTVEQFDRLIAASRPWLRRAMIVATRSGLRGGELIALSPAWLERRGAKATAIVVPAKAAKSGRSRRIPLHGDLAPIVATVDGDEPIIRGEKGKPLARLQSLDSALKRACSRAGLERVGTHAARRSFGRWAVLGQGPWEGRPVPMYVVSQWLGHSSLAMTARYLALDESASDAWMGGESSEDDD